VFQLFSILKHLRGLNKITENETFRFFLQKSNRFVFSRSLHQIQIKGLKFSDEKEKRWKTSGVSQSPTDV
jgi:hypothetical protein